jgi:regulator of cell morphogenesis and NO signaling
MSLYSGDSKLCDVLLAEPTSITVINRFNINLGVGDNTINEICKTHGIDPSFFLVILNTYLNEDYFPECILMSFDLRLIVEYLSKTNDYYCRFELPNIERHFNPLVAQNDSEISNLELLRKFFMEMRHELLASIDKDKNILFPILMEIASKKRIGLDKQIYHAIDDGQRIEDKLSDLLSFFVIHLRGDCDPNLCRAVVTAIFTLEKDIRQNNRIRQRILRPVCENLIVS